MKKVNIDQIIEDSKKGNLAPSPDKYKASLSDFEFISPLTTRIGVRRVILDSKVLKSNSPGPGSYSP